MENRRETETALGETPEACDELKTAPDYIKQAVKEGKMTIADALNEIKVSQDEARMGITNPLPTHNPRREFDKSKKKLHQAIRTLGIEISSWKANDYYRKWVKSGEDHREGLELTISLNALQILQEHIKRLQGD